MRANVDMQMVLARSSVITENSLPLIKSPITIDPEHLANSLYFNHLYEMGPAPMKSAPLALYVFQEPDSLLTKALKAQSLGFLILNKRYIRFEHLAYVRYGEAISAVREMIGRPDVEVSNSLILALSLSITFEVYLQPLYISLDTNVLQQWTRQLAGSITHISQTHRDGLEALLMAKPPESRRQDLPNEYVEHVSELRVSRPIY